VPNFGAFLINMFAIKSFKKIDAKAAGLDVDEIYE